MLYRWSSLDLTKFLISRWQNKSYQKAKSNETKEDGLQDICYESS